MKIKVKPDDFSVNEIADLALKKRGRFACYHLYKQGWNTVELIRHLSKKLSVEPSAFSYGGRKDRSGSTWQYITIDNPKGFASTTKSYQLKFLGFMDRPMGPDLIRANEFEVVVRDIDLIEQEIIMRTIDQIASSGYPNYFDDQRFGSYNSLHGFLAEKILKRHFNGALKILLTLPSMQDPAPEKKRKEFLGRHWGQWKLCLGTASGILEKQAFSYLIKRPKGFLAILKKVPAHDLSFYFSVYQSYLWNELLRRIIKKTCPGEITSFKGTAGDYLFPATNDAPLLGYLKGLSLALPCAKAQMPDMLTKQMYDDVLAGAGIQSGMFNSIKTRQSFFGCSVRRAWVTPENFSYKIAPDELYKDRLKLTLKYRLPRGSFATMLVKRAFSRQVRTTI